MRGNMFIAFQIADPGLLLFCLFGIQLTLCFQQKVSVCLYDTYITMGLNVKYVIEYMYICNNDEKFVNAAYNYNL